MQGQNCREADERRPKINAGADEVINLKPIGRVECDINRTAPQMSSGWPATIRVLPEYEAALHRIGEYSHLWILCWFHESQRDLLRVRPSRSEADLPEYGVFALRSPVRPNPISLTTVKLHAVEGDLLHVSGLDAIDGTGVLDIKPYFGSDVIFAFRSPYLRAATQERRQEMFWRMAMDHHGEDCRFLQLAVRMAMQAEALLGNIQDEHVQLVVRGPACLADALQGMTRARLANPSRFVFLGDRGEMEVVWSDQVRMMRMTLRPEALEKRILEVAEEELFEVKIC